MEILVKDPNAWKRSYVFGPLNRVPTMLIHYAKLFGHKEIQPQNLFRKAYKKDIQVGSEFKSTT